VNGGHIERYLSTYFSPNTHLLGETVALFVAGTLCPELPDAGRWQQHGWDIVLQQAERQVQSDGMHFEQSVYYHVYALDFFLHARTLAARNEIPIPVAFDHTIEKMLEVLCVLTQAGPPPRLGDDDGGRVFNPRRNLAKHMVDPLATGAVLFRRGDFKAAAGRLPEETVWLLGPGSVTQFEQLILTERPRASIGLSPSGVYIMADANPIRQQMVVDAGPQGTGSAGHGHADALSLCLSVNGREWLTDAGTFSYLSSDTARDAFRGTAAHNTLQVDGLSQASPDGPFAWGSLPQVRLDRWVTGETFDLFAGSHRGYCRLTDPVVHRRWVFHLKPGFWFVRDLAEGSEVHQLDLFWHFAPGITLHNDAAGRSACLSGDQEPGGDALMLVPLEGHRWEMEISRVSVSPVYGRQQPAAVLHFGALTQLPADFAVLLLSSGRVVDEPGVLTELLENHSGARGYCYRDSISTHYLFFGDGGKNWNLGPWESDADFVYFGTDASGRQHWVICDGCYVEAGRRHIRLKCRVPWFEWLSDASGRQTSCSDESMLSPLGAQDLVVAGQTTF
jgi:hypothetical protein